MFIGNSLFSIPGHSLTAKILASWLMNVTCDVLTFRVVSAEGNVCRGDHLAWLSGSRQLQLRPSDLGRDLEWWDGTNITLRPWRLAKWARIHFNQEEK